jgi:hypothetical protein
LYGKEEYIPDLKNDNVIEEIESFGFSREYIERSVASRVLNHPTACYYTLIDKEGTDKTEG